MRGIRPEDMTDAPQEPVLRALSAAQLPALAAELCAALDGFILVDIAPLPPRDVLLIFAERWGDDGRSEGGVRRLHLSASREAARAHIQHGSSERHKGPEGPFYQRLRAELIAPDCPTRLDSITQPKGDRALRLQFRGTPSGQPFDLMLELFGGQANLLLLGRGDVLLAVLAEPTGKSATRLVPGEPWELPGRGAGGPPRESPTLESFTSTAGPAPERRFPLDAPLSWIVEALIGSRADELDSARSRKTLLARIERRLARAKSQLGGLAKRRASAEASDDVRHEGELLQTHLGQIERGAKELVVTDWVTNEERTIKLDPARSAKQNLEQIFSRYKKLQRALTGMQEEEARATEKVNALESLFARAADEATAPEAIEAEAVAAGHLDAAQIAAPKPGREKAKQSRLPYRIFSASSGAEIRVGRTARDNDTLTTRHCRGNDMWLHTADSPGSHVVLCLAGAKDPDPEDLLDAATLALYFSPQRGSKKADIHIARGKEVHKPRGAKAGLVTLSGGRTLHLRADDGRLRRLTTQSKPTG